MSVVIYYLILTNYQCFDHISESFMTFPEITWVSKACDAKNVPLSAVRYLTHGILRPCHSASHTNDVMSACIITAVFTNNRCYCSDAHYFTTSHTSSHCFSV